MRHTKPGLAAHKYVFALFLICTPTLAAAQSFFTHFLKPEFLVPVSEFPATSAGDLNLVYYQVPIPVVQNGELLILGEFPRSRYFSITAYDDHGAIIGVLNDKDIQPYGSAQNPYTPGGPAGAEDILYAVTLRLSGGLATAPLPQCATPLSVHQNVLDARMNHVAGTVYSSDQSGFAATVAGTGNVTHNDGATNTGAFLLIRSYLRQAPLATSQFDLRKPLVWVRASSTGCSPQLTATGQALSASQWFSLASVLNVDQVYAHVQHEIDLGTAAPFGQDPLGQAPWFGRQEYVPGGAIGRYLSTTFPAGFTPADLNAQGRVLQMQVKLPQMPCRIGASCALTGNEELRYWSVTFEDQAGNSLATLSDLHVTPNASGYATIVLTFGAAVPAHVVAANGYNKFVMNSTAPARIVMRNYLPADAFQCSTWNVPFRTAEYHPGNGYMGEYAPIVTFPTAASLPAVAVPVVQQNNCQYP